MDEQQRKDIKALRNLVSLCRSIHQSGLIDNFENRTVSELIGHIELNYPHGSDSQSEWARHGVKWEDDETAELIALFKAEQLNIKDFATRYQRKPGSVRSKMLNLGLLVETDDL